LSDEVWAVVVAAGEGRRYGAAKQFELLGHQAMYSWAVQGARTVAAGVVLVVPPGREAEADLMEAADQVVAGGGTRAASVRAGLAAVPATAEVLVVHDAARPLASPALWQAVVSAVRDGADCAIPGVALSDTVKEVHEGLVTGTLDRGVLVGVQTPQAFRAEILRKAHAGDGDATDDAALVEAMGVSVHVVPGEPTNIKVTSPDDLAFAEWQSTRVTPTTRSH
jgi:2-C-methyl-D-erythritol 4-phosphate cytidylyltransferase